MINMSQNTDISDVFDVLLQLRNLIDSEISHGGLDLVMQLMIKIAREEKVDVRQ
jgi:hypothetical protein